MKYLESEAFNLIPSGVNKNGPKPKILILYGSLRERSFSRLLAEEAGRILEFMGSEVKFFNPEGLPLFDYDKSAYLPKRSKVFALGTLLIFIFLSSLI